MAAERIGESTERFKDAVQTRDVAGLRTLLASHPDLRAGIDRPIFGADAPAIVFCRHDRAMVDVLLEFGADVDARSQFWGRTIGVLDDNAPEMRTYLVQRARHASGSLGTHRFPPVIFISGNSAGRRC